MNFLTRLNETLVLGLIALLLIFNYAFMVVRFFNVPIVEITLIPCLILSFFIYRKKIRLNVPILYTTWLWWGYSFAVILTFITLNVDNVWWILRDASFVIESVFLLFGFAFSLEKGFERRVLMLFL